MAEHLRPATPGSTSEQRSPAGWNTMKLSMTLNHATLTLTSCCEEHKNSYRSLIRHCWLCKQPFVQILDNRWECTAIMNNDTITSLLFLMYIIIKSCSLVFYKRYSVLNYCYNCTFRIDISDIITDGVILLLISSLFLFNCTNLIPNSFNLSCVMCSQTFYLKLNRGLLGFNDTWKCILYIYAYLNHVPIAECAYL